MGLVSTHTIHSRSSVQYESSSTAEEEDVLEEEGHFFGHWAAATPPLAGRLWPNPGLWFPFAWWYHQHCWSNNQHLNAHTLLSSGDPDQ